MIGQNFPFIEITLDFPYAEPKKIQYGKHAWTKMGLRLLRHAQAALLFRGMT
jgi:hypothetical protein